MTENTEVTQLLLQGKRNKEQEYTMHLFEKCNLSCSFCWQDHKAYDGVDTIRDKVKPMVEMFEEDPLDELIVNVMGGEVFDDSIFDDKLFDDYVYLATELHANAVRLGKTVVVNFVSNLVTEQPHRVIELLEHLRSVGVDSRLTTSYDSKGRFNSKQFELYKSNMTYFGDYVSGVSMLLSRPVIKQLMEFKDPYFQYLYDAGYEIYFDYYTPTTGWAGAPPGEEKGTPTHMVIAPSDKDLLTAFYFLINNYPNVQPIRGWIENYTNHMSCRSSKLVLADGTKCMCGNLHLENKQIITFYKSAIRPNDNHEIEENFLKRWDCLSCEYFQRCQLGCFMQHDFTKRGQMVECPFKLTFDKITKNIEVDLDTVEVYYGNKDPI